MKLTFNIEMKDETFNDIKSRIPSIDFDALLKDGPVIDINLDEFAGGNLPTLLMMLSPLVSTLKK